MNNNLKAIHLEIVNNVINNKNNTILTKNNYLKTTDL